MAIKYYDTPFHVNHDAETAINMAMKVDLSIKIAKLIKERGLTQADAAEMLAVHQSRISELVNAKIEKFTIDTMVGMLDKLGFQAQIVISEKQVA